MKHLRRISSNINKTHIFCIKMPIIIIGRDKEQADLILENNEPKSYISRIHSRIVASNDNYKIFDDSRNGIFINNIKIHNEAILNEGDLITFGHPFGEKFSAGERVRQPNSEFQYVFEYCTCDHLKEKLNGNINTDQIISLSTVPNSNITTKYNNSTEIRVNNNSNIGEKIGSKMSTNNKLLLENIPNHDSKGIIHDNEIITKSVITHVDSDFLENISSQRHIDTEDSRSVVNDILQKTINLESNSLLQLSDIAQNDYIDNIENQKLLINNEIQVNNNNFTENGNSCTKSEKRSFQRDSIIDSIIKSLLENVVLNKNYSTNHNVINQEDSVDLLNCDEGLVFNKRKIKIDCFSAKKIKLDLSNLCQEDILSNKSSSDEVFNSSNKTLNNKLITEVNPIEDALKNNSFCNKDIDCSLIINNSNDIQMVELEPPKEIFYEEIKNYTNISCSLPKDIHYIESHKRVSVEDTIEDNKSNSKITLDGNVSPTDLFFNSFSSNIKRTPRSKKTLNGIRTNLLDEF